MNQQEVLLEKVLLDQPDVLCLLEKIGAIAKGHIVYTSGRHGWIYINKDAIFLHTEVISRLCQAIAEKFVTSGVQVVIGPVIGGVILSQWTAHHLTDITEKEVLSMFAEGADIRRGYDKLVTGKKVLVVDDVITTGGSAKKVVEAVRASGGNVIGLGVIFNRGGITSQDVADVPELFALVKVKLADYSEDDCPFCAQNIPINTDVGKGRDFLARKQAIL